VAWKGAQGP